MGLAYDASSVRRAEVAENVTLLPIIQEYLSVRANACKVVSRRRVPHVLNKLGVRGNILTARWLNPPTAFLRDATHLDIFERYALMEHNEVIVSSSCSTERPLRADGYGVDSLGVTDDFSRTCSRVKHECMSESKGSLRKYKATRRAHNVGRTCPSRLPQQ